MSKAVELKKSVAPPLRLNDPLRQLVEGLDDGILLVGLDQQILFANAKALAMHGVKRTADLGATLDAYRRKFRLTDRNRRPLDADDIPVDEVIAGMKAQEVIVQVCPADDPDDERVYSIRCFAVATPDDKPDHLVIVVEDETERFEATDRFESAFNANPAPALICRLPDLRFVRVNAGFLDLSGYAKGDVLDRTLDDLDVFAGSDSHDEAHRRLRKHRPVHQTEADLATADGETRRVVVAGQPIGIDGKDFVLLTFADLEPRQQAQAALEASERRFAMAFRLSPAPTAILAADGMRFIEINDAFQMTFARTAEAIVGRKPLEVGFWKDRGSQARFEGALKERGGFRQLDFALRGGDGAEFDCVLAAETVSMAGEDHILCVFQDITDRKRSEAELVEAIEAVMSDASWFSRSIVEKLANFRSSTGDAAPTVGVDTLSDREREVLGLICEGRNSKEMAETLHLSPHTIRNHVASLYRKIDVASRSAAVVWARERGVTSLRPSRSPIKKGR